LMPDLANVHLGRIIQHVTKLRAEPETSSLEEISSTVCDLKVRVAALDCNQLLQRVVVDELAVRVNYTTARSLEDHDEGVNRLNEHKIVIHGLKSITAPGRVEVRAAALREVTRLFEDLFGPTHGCTIVQVTTF